MDWYYAIDGRQLGPVSGAQLDELLKAGTIDGQTLLWREGLANWQPLSLALTQATPPPPQGVPPIVAGGAQAACVECKRWFPQSDMVFLNRMWVCAACKPIFLQRLQEGSPLPGGIGGTVWRLHRQMILRPDTALPDRCVRCNAPANGYRLKRQLYWHPPAYYLFILVNLIVYAIVAICVRKKAVLHIGLCETHRSQRSYTMIGCWIAALGGLALFIGALTQSAFGVSFIGILIFIVGAVVGALRVPVVSPARIDSEFVRIKGAGEPFLSDLPEWTGPV